MIQSLKKIEIDLNMAVGEKKRTVGHGVGMAYYNAEKNATRSSLIFDQGCIKFKSTLSRYQGKTSKVAARSQNIFLFT